LKDGKRRMINKNHIKSIEEGDKEAGSVVHWCIGKNWNTFRVVASYDELMTKLGAIIIFRE
jgi:hypothetical protein